MSSPSTTVISAPPEWRAALLYREQVGEIRIRVQFQRHHGALMVEVVQRNDLPQSVGHHRSRTTSSVLSANPALRRPAQDELRRKGFRDSTDNDSADLAVDTQFQRDSTRMSRKNSPCEPPATMSPCRSDRQNVAPSTSVPCRCPLRREPVRRC